MSFPNLDFSRIRVLPNEDGKHVYVRHSNTWRFNFSDYDSQVKM